MRLRIAVPALVLLLPTVACNQKRREQEKRMVADLMTMAEAATRNQELPELAKDPEAYGQGTELMAFMHERYGRMIVLNREIQGLGKESENWINPREWSDAATVKGYREKAERLVSLITEVEKVMDDTIGDEGRARIRRMGMSADFKRGILEGMDTKKSIQDLTHELLATSRTINERRVDILTLAEQKLVKVEDGIPKFPESADAERYRTLVQREKGEILRLREVAGRFQTQAVESMRDDQAKAKALLAKP